MLPLEQWQARFMAMLGGGAATTLGPSGIPAKQSQAIYRRNYHENHIQALAGTYEHVLALVGQDYFRQLARRYLAAYPSRSGDLNHYGEHFAVFLAEQLPQAPGGEALPYLPDMAALDWACWRALLAPRNNALTLGTLLSWPVQQQAQARLSLAPSCQLLGSDFPIHSLWRLAQGEALTVDLDAGGEAVLISRPHNEVQLQRLDKASACLLLHWQTQTLNESLAAVTAAHPGTDITALFAHLNTLSLAGELWSLS